MPHLTHLLVVLLVVLLLGGTLLIAEYFAMRSLFSEADIARERLRMAMTAGKSVGWEWDLRTGLDHWFGDLRTIFGIPSDTWSGPVESFFGYVHPDDRRHILQAVATARRDHTPYKEEFRVVHKDGTVRWIRATGSFHYTKKGQAERMLGMAVDMTEHKQVEEELRKSEEKFARTFRESPVAFTLTSAVDHRYLDVNTTFEQITGWKLEEVIGRTPFDINLWVEPAERTKFLERLRAVGPLRGVEVRFRRRDGKERIGLASGDLIEIANEPCVVSAVADITERKQIEKRLYDSEQRMSGIVDSAMDAIIAADETQRIVLFNLAAEKMFGCQAGEAIGSPLGRFIPAALRERHEQHVRSFGESGITSRSVSDLPTLYGLRASGEQFPLEASVSQVSAAGGKLFIAIIRDITERRRGEELLRTSADRLHLAVRAGKMYVDEWEIASGSITRSPECADVLGEQEPLQIKVEHLLKWIHPDDQPRLEHFVESITPQHPISQISYRFLRPDGSVIWLEKSAHGVFDESGKLLRTIGAVVDVTERKQAEQALRSSEERFRRVVEHINDALIIDDEAGRIIFANDRFLHMFGFTREQLPDVTIEDYVAPEYHAELRDLHNRRMKGKVIPRHYEYEGMRVDGQRMWLEVDVVPIAGENGKLIGTQSAIRDITERKRRALSLLESEHQFRLVANTAPVMVWMSGADKLCSYFNQQWLDFTGRPLEAEIGKGWAEGVHPEDLSACLDTYSQAFDRREVFEMQYRMRRRDGEYRWLYDRGVPRFNPDGSFAGYIGSCYDVTDRKLAEETLRQLGRRLIEAHEQERTWIARDLHDDISQRLALLTIELGRWSQDTPEAALDIKEHFAQARQQLFEISKDVQALSHRLHSSKLEYLGLAAATKSFCREFSDQHKVQIQFSQAGVLTNVPTEVSLALFRVMQEALQNAVKHSRQNKFDVSLRGETGEIHLSVSDPGRGFDPREAMCTHGLGLISMRERLQLVNGSLVIDSKPGQGTTIRARVPIPATGVSQLSAAG